jgi:hypothetical protein
LEAKSSNKRPRQDKEEQAYVVIREHRFDGVFLGFMFGDFFFFFY